MLNGNLLRGRIAAAGMNQKELAVAIEMSENTLSSRMRGGSSFTCDEVERVCHVLGITEAQEKCDIFLARPSHN